MSRTATVIAMVIGVLAVAYVISGVLLGVRGADAPSGRVIAAWLVFGTCLGVVVRRASRVTARMTAGVLGIVAVADLVAPVMGGFSTTAGSGWIASSSIIWIAIAVLGASGLSGSPEGDAAAEGR